MSPQSDSWRSSGIGRSARTQGRRNPSAKVQQSVQIGCLSNTNSMHWKHQTSLWPVLDMFDFRFLSFELGLAEPDEAVFHAVTERLPFSRDRILSLDDLAVNCDAAGSFGFRSKQVRGINEVRTALRRFGVLRPRRGRRGGGEGGGEGGGGGGKEGGRERGEKEEKGGERGCVSHRPGEREHLAAPSASTIGSCPAEPAVHEVHASSMAICHVEPTESQADRGESNRCCPRRSDRISGCEGSQQDN